MTSMSFTSCSERTARLPRRRSAVAARAAARLVRAGWRAYWDWRARKATVLILRSLDCRTLHDIGIHPTEIESLVYGGGDEHCRRRYNPAWPWQSAGA
jgi:uncharacterized protein YjiS (DUF1127 family)